MRMKWKSAQQQMNYFSLGARGNLEDSVLAACFICNKGNSLYKQMC